MPDAQRPLPRTIDLPRPGGRKTHVAATEHDGVLYLAGVIATADDGSVIGPGDPDAQARACLDQIEQVLAAAGSGLGDILRATCFGTTTEAVRAYIAERNRRLPQTVAATSVLVSALLLPEALIEVEVIARAPSRR